jgi:hypothetical protein
MNAATSSTNVAHAGSPARRMWFRLSSATSREPRIRPETSTALSNVVDRSPVAWRISDGAVIR